VQKHQLENTANGADHRKAQWAKYHQELGNYMSDAEFLQHLRGLEQGIAIVEYFGELFAALAPGLGFALAAYELNSNKDIWGHEITDPGRQVLNAISLGLPIASVVAPAMKQGARALGRFGKTLKKTAKGAGRFDDLFRTAIVTSRTNKLDDVAGFPRVPRKLDDAPPGARNVQFGMCFARDTQVATPDGPRPIETIEPGEHVWAFDFEAGEWIAARVEHRSDTIYHGPTIRVLTSGGAITATAYHPFWVVDGGDLHERNTPRELAEHEDEGFSLPGRWVNSHELRAGDILIGRDGELQTVRKLEQHYDPEFAVSNLTIAKHHTFSVGPDAILVHNTSGSSVGDQFGSGGTKKAALHNSRMSLDEALENGLTTRDKHWPWRGSHTTEQHHPLMRGKSFRRFWKDRGFTDAEIDNITKTLDTDVHRAIEESGFWQDELIKRIKAQERGKGRLLTRGEVMGVVDELLKEIGGWSL